MQGFRTFLKFSTRRRGRGGCTREDPRLRPLWYLHHAPVRISETCFQGSSCPALQVAQLVQQRGTVKVQSISYSIQQAYVNSNFAGCGARTAWACRIGLHWAKSLFFATHMSVGLQHPTASPFVLQGFHVLAQPPAHSTFCGFASRSAWPLK